MGLFFEFARVQGLEGLTQWATVDHGGPRRAMAYHGGPWRTMQDPTGRNSHVFGEV